MKTPGEQRSKTMKAVKSRNTKPEMKVRRLLFSMGYRYRLHGQALPGKPDIVFTSRRKVIFVHGCFWHGHRCKRGNRIPKTNTDYWQQKISRNVSRFSLQAIELRDSGWEVLTIWECELKNELELRERLHLFLDKTGDSPA